MKKVISLFIISLLSQVGHAQEVEMADGMRADGKIYVVVAIVVAILAGLLAYVFLLDRKANRLEKKLDELMKK